MTSSSEFIALLLLEKLFEREPLAKLLSQGESLIMRTLLVDGKHSRCSEQIGGGASMLTNTKRSTIFCQPGDFRRAISYAFIEQQKKKYSPIADTIMVVPRPSAVALAAEYFGKVSLPPMAIAPRSNKQRSSLGAVLHVASKN